MIKMFPRILLYGENFLPSEIEKSFKLVLSNKIQKGEIGKSGRYRNKLVPYSSASIIPPENIDNESDKIIWLANIINQNKKMLIEYGCTDITFHIDVDYKYQCNFEFDPIILKMLSELDIPLTITCWNITNESE